MARIRAAATMALWFGLWAGLGAQTAIEPKPALSDQARISVVTQWPGQEIYLSWGHAAFRVVDPASGIDRIFNYGTFSVEDPWFVARFVRGQLDYFLSAYPFEPYLEWDVANENRAWDEQVLNLDPAERQALYEFLSWNAEPANAVYRYDFIRDNCSTRIRDALERILGPKLLYPAAGKGDGDSYRSGIDAGVADQAGFGFLFSLVVGSAADRPSGLRESTWRPLYLHDLLERCRVARGAGAEPLVAGRQWLFRPAAPTARADFNPAWACWPLALLAGLALARRARRRRIGAPLDYRLPGRLADGALFLAAGLMACLLCFLNFWSDHSAVKGNWNLVWLLPLHLPAAIAVFRKRRPRWLAVYFAAAAGLTALCLALWPIWPQSMSILQLPFMLLLLARCLAQTQPLWPGRRTETGA